MLTKRKLLKRKLTDLERYIRGSLRGYGLFVGAIARGAVRELIERSGPIFIVTIEGLAEARRAFPRIRIGCIVCYCKWCRMMLSAGI